MASGSPAPISSVSRRPRTNGGAALLSSASNHTVSSYILFLLLGLGAGAVYAMLALGLVLKYRSAGVVDFGHGAVAMFIAYVYLGLREDGDLQFPWIWLPHSLSLGSG